MKTENLSRCVKGKGCRVKGHAFERWVANKFKEIYPDAKRHLEFQKAEAIGVDIDHAGPYRVQCKRLKKYAPISKIHEVQLDPIEGGVPCLVTKADGLEPLIVLPFSHFLELIKHDAKR